MTSKICLCLTADTLEKDLALVEKYRPYIDLVELRADYLSKDERLSVRRFPELAGLPCILTIRRKIDGGCYIEGEANRTTLFARALAFAEDDKRKNFAYVDFEEDFYVPILQEAALAFDTRIIRSYHNMTACIPNISKKIRSLRLTGYEIPKIAMMPQNLQDVIRFFKEAAALPEEDRILVLMGNYGFPSRILACRLRSFLTFTRPEETIANVDTLGQIDPVTLNDLYGFRNITEKTALFGIAGYPLQTTLSPYYHNVGYHKHGLDAVYIPIKAKSFANALEFADLVGVQGLSITIPHKETALSYLAEANDTVQEIGACNTILRKKDGAGNDSGEWAGYDTDAVGLIRALKDFLGKKNLARLKVAIIGAGGAAKAAAYAVSAMKGKACIFNRTVNRAKALAKQYKFRWASLGPESNAFLEMYKDLIIQTTSVGMNCNPGSAGEEFDPLYFYLFSGKEAVYDIIYTPETTPLLGRAKKAGCRTSNGRSMLNYQAFEQFKIFTGVTF